MDYYHGMTKKDTTSLVDSASKSKHSTECFQDISIGGHNHKRVKMMNLIKQRSSSIFAQPTLNSLIVRAFSNQSIPINGTARLVRLKVNGEANAIKAQEILAKGHQILKKEGKGYVGATRFVCKSEWDVYCFYRFTNLDSLKGFMGSDVKEKKLEPLLNELKALAFDGKAHSQNFVADDW